MLGWLRRRPLLRLMRLMDGLKPEKRTKEAKRERLTAVKCRGPFLSAAPHPVKPNHFSRSATRRIFHRLRVWATPLCTATSCSHHSLSPMSESQIANARLRNRLIVPTFIRPGYCLALLSSLGDLHLRANIQFPSWQTRYWSCGIFIPQFSNQHLTLVVYCGVQIDHSNF